MRIALLDPFYDVSHAQWARGLKAHSVHEIDIYCLKPVHWKWKMAAGAVSIADQVNKAGVAYDLLLGTDMLNVPLFKSLLNEDLDSVPVALYFHENQITYPWSDTDKDSELNRDHHYGWINFTSAIVSEKLFFNSHYHYNSFFDALPNFLLRFPKNNLTSHIQKLKKKSVILPVGLKLPEYMARATSELKKPTFIWNHRWESDKNPALFLDALRRLKKAGISFNLIVCGKEYQQKPVPFALMKMEFSEEIIHWGFVQSRQQYIDLLHQSDIALVTSQQDYFGISVVEAISAGCIPLLPYRLAYPEHIPPVYHDQYIYKSDTSMYDLLCDIIDQVGGSTLHLSQYVAKYDWNQLISIYDSELESLNAMTI